MSSANHTNGQSPMLSDIETLHRRTDDTLKKLLGFKALLIKAQLAGLETVNLEDGQLHVVALELAIDAVELLCNVGKGGAA